MDILFVGTELDKFLKEGGLGDYIFDLSTSLAKFEDNNVSVILPNFKNINSSEFEVLGEYSLSDDEIPEQYLSYKILYKKQYGINIYLVDNDFYYYTDNIYNDNDFLKFSFFNRVVYEFIQMNSDLDIVHLNDWHCGLLPKLLQNQDNVKVVLTIHNAGYQGYFDNLSCDELKIFSIYYGEEYSSDEINFFKIGVTHCDNVLTVSHSYIDDGVIPALKELGIDKKINGIINGMNPEIYPREYASAESFLEFKRNAKVAIQKEYGLQVNENIPLFVSIGRLFIQKGVDLIIDVIDDLTQDCQLIILGTGDENYEKTIVNKAKSNKNLVSLIEFNSDIAMKLYQSADMFLMPSLFEPCGIAQLIAMYYGTVPIVHNVGGLRDTVINYDLENGCGFKYDNQETLEFLNMINISKEYYKNKDKWIKLVLNASNHPYIWQNQVKLYLEYYNGIS